MQHPEIPAQLCCFLLAAGETQEQSVCRPKKTGLDLPVQTVPRWVPWRMEGQVVLLSPHSTLDTKIAAEVVGLQTYSILHISWWLYLTVVTVMFLLSFSDFQDWRKEISTSSCDFTILSIWSNQQWVVLQRWVLPLWKVRGNLRSQDFQSPCHSSTAGTRKLSGMKLGSLRSGMRCHSCRHENTCGQV